MASPLHVPPLSELQGHHITLHNTKVYTNLHPSHVPLDARWQVRVVLQGRNPSRSGTTCALTINEKFRKAREFVAPRQLSELMRIWYALIVLHMHAGSSYTFVRAHERFDSDRPGLSVKGGWQFLAWVCRAPYFGGVSGQQAFIGTPCSLTLEPVASHWTPGSIS